MTRILLGASLGSSRLRVRALLGVERCREVDILESTNLAEELRGIAVVVLGVAHHRGHSAGAAAKFIRGMNPSIAIYVVAENLADLASAIHGLAQHGVDEAFVLQHPSDEAHFAARVRQRLLAPAPARVMDWVHANMPRSSGYQLLTWTLLNGYWRPSIVEAASVFWIERNTVRRHLTDAGYSTFGEIRRISLLVHALELRSLTGCSRVQAARRLGFLDGSELSQINREFREKCRNASLWSLPLLYA